MTFYLFLALIAVFVMMRVSLSRMKARISVLECELGDQRTSLNDFARRFDKLVASGTVAAEDVPERTQRVAEAPPTAPPPANDDVAEAPLAQDTEPEPEAEDQPLYGPRRAAAAARVETARTAPKIASTFEKTFDDVEKDLSTKWMIWLGGVALALGGGFLVKYSIDAGVLSPGVRVTLATLFGLLLAAGGEVVRRKRQDLAFLTGTPDYLPAAISAGGIFTLFAAIYSAYALYGFIAPLTAFVMLALLSLGASALALLQGRFFAYLGLVCGMVAPLLVSTGDPSAWTLFPYLLLIAGAGTLVAKRVGADDVSLTSLTLAGGWAVLWTLTNWAAGDAVPVGLYTLALGGMNVLAGHGTGTHAHSDHAKATKAGEGFDVISAAVFGLLFMLVRFDGYSAFSLGLFTVATLAQGWLVLRDRAHDTAGLSAVLSSLLLLTVWHEGALGLGALTLSDGWGGADVMSPGAGAFLSACFIAAALVGGFVFLARCRLTHKVMWAWVGAVYPIAVLVLAYWRLADFGISMPFALASLGIAALSTLAVASVRKSASDWAADVMAAYAAAATLTVALAFTMVLRDGWLTIALALEVAALGYIWRMLDAAFLRTFATILAGTVLVRLLLNPAVLYYAASAHMGVFNWMVVGYGFSAALFILAARLFAARGEGDNLTALLNAGAALLLVAFSTLEIRVLAGGSGGLTGDVVALEAALQTVNWTAAAAILMWLEIRTGNELYAFLRKFMTGISIVAFIVAGGMFNNILMNNAKLGPYIFWNLQLLQYLVPSLILAAQALMARRAGWQDAFQLYGGAFLIGIFGWLTLEVRHAFHPYGGQAPTGEWELYAYSFVWLVYAVALMFTGLRLEQQRIRQAGLAVLALVVVKVFIIDMSSLEGVARALSFMGLGGGLIGIGYLYQKLSRSDVRE